MVGKGKQSSTVEHDGFFLSQHVTLRFTAMLWLTTKVIAEGDHLSYALHGRRISMIVDVIVH